MPGSLGGRTTIGKLRHRLAIQSAVENRNEFCEAEQPAWATEAETFGLVDSVNGREFPRSGTVQANTSH